MAYNMLSGGDTLSDVNRLRGDDGLRRLLGNARIPHASTVGDFLARFDGKREGSSKRDQQAGKVALIELREAIEEIQQRAFAFYRDPDSGEIACRTTDDYLDIEPNAIVEAFNDLYDREIDRGMKGWSQ